MTSFSLSEIHDVIFDANVQEEDILAYACFGHPENECYGRVMAYDGGFFKIMIMTWNPGDFTAIHDHGFMQWGAVQVFGDAENANFLANDGKITTLSREILQRFEITTMDHDVIHQMGNSRSESFLSLQVYGNHERSHGVTDDARIFDLAEGKITRGDGGAFFAMPEDQIKKRENAPKPDYPTWLRHQVELIRRIRRCTEKYPYTGTHDIKKLVQDLFDANIHHKLITAFTEYQGEDCCTTRDSLLNWEVKQAAQLQDELLSEQDAVDSCRNYASLNDEASRHRCLRSFKQGYLNFFVKKYCVNAESVLCFSCVDYLRLSRLNASKMCNTDIRKGDSDVLGFERRASLH